MDVEDWKAQWEDGALEAAEPPEDWSGSVDVEPEEMRRARRMATRASATCARAGSTASICSNRTRLSRAALQRC